MIQKLELMVKSVTSSVGYIQGNSEVELTVSIIDMVNKLNEIIDHINAKETDGKTG